MTSATRTVVAHPCAVCGFGTPPNDRVELLDDHVVAHVVCGLERMLAGQTLVGALPVLDGEPGDAYARTRKRTHVRTQARSYEFKHREERTAMPRPSHQLMAMMHADGYVSLGEAQRLSGHGAQALRGWIDDQKLEARRSGAFFWWVRFDDLVRLCPQAASARTREGLVLGPLAAPAPEITR